MRLATVIPGVGIAVGGAAVALAIDHLAVGLLGVSSTILWAIVLGICTGNIGLPSWSSPGLSFSAKQVLRAGIVLLGLEISLTTLASLGWPVLVGSVLIVFSGMTTAAGLAKRSVLSFPHAILIGAGCSICGAAAVSAVEAVLPKRKAEEIASAISVVVVLGTAMIVLGPAFVSALDWHELPAGVFIGGATHEVGQVVAAGGIAGATVLPLAVAVKLSRVLLLVPVVLVVGYRERPQLRGLVPCFVLLFLVAVVVRTVAPIPPLALEWSTQLRAWLFAVAMFALGTTVTASALRRAGWRPFLFGLVVSLVVAIVAGLVAITVTQLAG
ncbi:YeiH family protein [Corynebacterium epidermidicanis]|uniref:Putative membrane protein n=1 Tax=Corynebacterium epidermidicanis TaxID=1050174 RepID=A0A0G3GT17_9CORY|nr:putative sulfate exporter family transporter [Corynebacterium epidermidicanis]AKK03680.1 putative membrane protein [Corynebacterium epidermidicanis]